VAKRAERAGLLHCCISLGVFTENPELKQENYAKADYLVGILRCMSGISQSRRI